MVLCIIGDSVHCLPVEIDFFISYAE